VSAARGVARLEEAASIRFEHVAVARAETERRILERRERFLSVDVDGDATVVLMGSWGRREVTSESDDDFMVLFEGSSRAGCRPLAAEVARVLGARPPGREEIFATQVWLEELRGKIGRDEDSNANLTRRMLFMLESVPVCGEEVHARARRALLAGYLEANVKDHRPPRFLLNDLVRYWRTIAVDFESKMRARKGEGGHELALRKRCLRRPCHTPLDVPAIAVHPPRTLHARSASTTGRRGRGLTAASARPRLSACGR
jgi:hypothetical protein